MAPQIAQERLKELFTYDAITGVLSRLVATSNRVKIGDIVGSIDSKGYWRVGVDGHSYRAHRLAWLYTHGEFPPDQIDHIDGDKLNNRIANLRPVSMQENQRNERLSKNNTSGIIGVTWSRCAKKWVSQITVSRKNIYLGCYKDLELASFVRKEAEIKYGFHPNHGSIK